ncbi:secretion protein HlyD [Betaproteobacteria bacterium GR16-43]|nr:secretion protein HlyD [Betaproteobacteria bacterium GR16-43]
MRRLLLPLAIAATLSACGGPDNNALQGYAEGEYVRVAAPFAGTLVRLEVARGASVAPGAPLFALEAENETAARREAEDRVRRAEAQRDNLKKGARPTELEALRAQVAQTQSSAELARRDLTRTEELVKKGFLPPQKLDEARMAVENTRQRVRENESQLATANLGGRPDEIRAAESEVEAARASLAQADWRLRQKTVASTVTGLVTDTNFVAGEWVPAGAPVVAVLPPENVKVRFFVPEPRLGAVKVGQAVELACDGCPAKIAATVSFVAPQAEYTPPVIYSRESRAKLVFLVEARPAKADAAKLHPGQPVDVRLP